jgi:hypothetical protein
MDGRCFKIFWAALGMSPSNATRPETQICRCSRLGRFMLRLTLDPWPGSARVRYGIQVTLLTRQAHHTWFERADAFAGLILTVEFLILGWRRRLSQYPPGAVSPPARHLAQIKFGHEILGGARGHFEFPRDQSRG